MWKLLILVLNPLFFSLDIRTLFSPMRVQEKGVKKSGLRTRIKSFHSGYSDLVVRIKCYPF